MKLFENNCWCFEKCHSRFFVTPDLFRGRIFLFAFCLLFLVFLSACTDYVSQIDDRYGEWGTSVEPGVTTGSSSSFAESSSSEAWLLQTGSLDIVIYSNGVVTDTQGNIIGTYDALTGSINDVYGYCMFEGVDLNLLPKYDPESFAVATSSSSVTEYSSSRSGEFMTDSRDGQTYKIVKIGEQTWMAQNLNYETTNSYCYKDIASYCDKYGRLYTWAAAMDSVGAWSKKGKGCGYDVKCTPTYPVRGICPAGWHLPTKTEWNALFNAVGGQSTASTKLKSTSGWNNNGNGSDTFSFMALPAGNRYYYGGDYDEGNLADFWSSTEKDSVDAYDVYLNNNSDSAYLDYDGKSDAFSVRCLKD